MTSPGLRRVAWLGRPICRWRASRPPAAHDVAVGILQTPVQVLMPEQDVEREAFLGIRDRLSRELVAVVELLSPANKH